MGKRKTFSAGDDTVERKCPAEKPVKKPKMEEKPAVSAQMKMAPIICDVCKKQFAKKVTLRKHQRRVHEMQPVIQGKLCEICQQNYYKKYEDHLRSDHDIPIEIDHLRFASMEGKRDKTIIVQNCSVSKRVFSFAHSARTEFGLWKECYEKETCSWYVNGVSDTCAYRSGRLYRYYYCNRRGRAKVIAKDGRKRERKESRKIGSICPSKIIVKQDADDNFKVSVIRTHVGHELDSRNVNIPKSEKEKVVEWLNDEIHADIIVERIRREWKKAGFEKQICSRDIHNIHKESKIQKKFVIRQDFEVTLKMWIDELKSMKPSPLLFVKNRDDPVSVAGLSPDDFILIISTNNQANMLKNYCTGGVFSMQSTTSLAHNCWYQLNILSVLVDNRKFNPLAYMYCTRMDAIAFRILFTSIRQRFGQINAKAFFVEDGPGTAFLDVWQTVMGLPSSKILYTGSFLNTWMEQLSILPEKKREEVRNYLNAILNETDPDTFQMNVQLFSNMCRANYELDNFRRFLEENYFHRCRMWAKCFVMPFLGVLPSDEPLPLDAAYHQSWVFLQQIFKLGNGYRKLDKAIALILKLDDCDYRMDQVFDVDPESAKNLNRQQKTYHHEMEKQKDSYFCQKIGPGEYELLHQPSATAVNKLDGRKNDANNGRMKVKFFPEVKCSCVVRCEQCKLCFHQASCDCLDHQIRCCICRHIHYVRIHHYSTEMAATMDQNHHHQTEQGPLSVTTPPVVAWPNRRSEQSLDATKASRQRTKLLELIDEVTMRMQTIRKKIHAIDYRHLHLPNIEKMTRAFQVVRKKLPTDSDIDAEVTKKLQPPSPHQTGVQDEHNYS